MKTTQEIKEEEIRLKTLELERLEQEKARVITNYEKEIAVFNEQIEIAKLRKEAIETVEI